MSKRIICNFKQLVALFLIAIMALPHIAFASELPWESPWSTLPEIAPLDPNRSDFYGTTSHTQPESTFLSLWDPESMLPSSGYIINNELSELPPDILEEILREQEAYWSIDWRTRESIQFSELLSSGISFSALDEDDRNLIYRRLDIAHEAIGVTAALFVLMQGDGFSLSDSIELMRIMSGGIFNYQEAQVILQNFPDNTERAIELSRFERFAQRFDINDRVNATRLINRSFQPSFAPSNGFDEAEVVGFAVSVLPDISAFLNVRNAAS